MSSFQLHPGKHSKSLIRDQSQGKIDGGVAYDDITHLFKTLESSHKSIDVINPSTGVISKTNPVQIITKSKSSFLAKYHAMIMDGPSKLKIVSDFDFTITKYHVFTYSNTPDHVLTPVKHPAMNVPIADHFGSPLSQHIQVHGSTLQRTASNASLHRSASNSENMDTPLSLMSTPERPKRATTDPIREESNRVIMASRHRGTSCHGVLEDCKLLHPVFHEQAVENFNKYYPIESDPRIAYEAKYPLMAEWAHKSHDLLLHKSGLTFSLLKKAVYEAVQERRIEPRNFTRSLFEFSRAYEIPFLIFSAGIADILEKVLEYSFTFPTNGEIETNEDESKNHNAIGKDNHPTYHLLKDVHVISNKCIFHDESIDHQTPNSPKNQANNLPEHPPTYHPSYIPPANHQISREPGWGNATKNYGKLVGFHTPLIHTLNKRASTYLTASPFLSSQSERQRHNVILLGDSPGDISMSDGMTTTSFNTLRVGYLNDKISERLSAYLNMFDVVILGDEAGMEVPLEIVGTICHPENRPIVDPTKVSEPIDTHSTSIPSSFPLSNNLMLADELSKVQGYGDIDSPTLPKRSSSSTSVGGHRHNNHVNRERSLRGVSEDSTDNRQSVQTMI